ncbi:MULTISPECIES: sulfurtransferase [Dyella]|uniref:Sulfurtransferase n=2 Tax=Dyella TaxID=231454 RepID=A0A4R0YVB6_9GAMM|nr:MULTISPECIES: sulfurtransferase [Dyella]TBR39025.1 sulfurtransferase [Dyella terrae]TCI13383.1 sulfurtransferase [Dyella soli]
MTLRTPLIDAAALRAMSPSDVLIVDCRIDLSDRSKSERAYLDGHIPGAVYVSLEDDLSDLSRIGEGLGRHPLPMEQAFSAVLSRIGWKPGLSMVCYDSAGGSLAAARLWWMMRLVGVHDVAVLDGGIQAWEAAGYPLESGKVERGATTVSLSYDARTFTTQHSDVSERPDQLLVDARAAPRYRGDVEPLDRVGGHVPGALNRPFADNLDDQGRFKSPARLREEFQAVIGTTQPDHVVHMCGSGVTACHNLLAMEVAGLHGSRLYAPSWSGWVSDPARPVAKG